jgi:hypothetical protein
MYQEGLGGPRARRCRHRANLEFSGMQDSGEWPS